MLARHRQVFASGVFALDAVLIAGSWLGDYALRFHALPAPLGVPSLSFYLWFGAVLTPVALLVLRTFKIYRSARTARLSQELLALAQGMIIVGALAAILLIMAGMSIERIFEAIHLETPPSGPGGVVKDFGFLLVLGGIAAAGVWAYSSSS